MDIWAVHNILAGMPRLWNETIEAHRREVRDTVLATTMELVAKHGLRSVTMSQIAEEAGIGRATLYKYFSDVEAILLNWHELQIANHLKLLSDIQKRPGGAAERLEAVLEAYALITHEKHGARGAEIVAFLHRDERVSRARQQLHKMIRDLLSEGAEASEFRRDTTPDELASYCLHALAGASTLSTKAAVRRLVKVILAGLHANR